VNLIDTGWQQERLTCDCGASFGANVLRVLNLSTHGELLDSLLASRLNLVRCAVCGREFGADTPVFVHDPVRGRYVCSFPSAWRSQELELRIQFYQELLGQGGPVPGYVRAASFAFGARACAQALERALPPSPWTTGRDESLPLGASPEDGEPGEAWVVAPLGAAAERGERGEEGAFEPGELDFTGLEVQDGAPTQQAEALERWREGGLDHHAFLDQGVLHLFQLQSGAEALGPRVDLFFQLHRLENFPLIALVLVAGGGEGPARSLVWLFNLDSAEDAAMLEALTRRFEVRVHLFDMSYRPLRGLVLSPPLEPNVTYALGEARRWYDRIEPKRRNFFLAASKFDSSGYERLGTSAATLDPGAFRELHSPSVARLALDILTYWSSRDKAEYLIFIRSFPLARFHAILAAVLTRAVHFGLAMTTKMRRLTVELGLAQGEPELLRALLGNFSEVCLGLRQNDLDPASQAENWEQLLRDARLLGVPVDDELLRLARRAPAAGAGLLPLEAGEGERAVSQALDGLPEVGPDGKNLVRQ